MRETVRPTPVNNVGAGASVEGLQLDVIPTTNGCVIFAAGTLDSASRDELVAALTAGGSRHMFLNLSAVTSMDRDGYEAIVDLRRRLDSGGQTLTISGFTRQQNRFLALIEQLQLLDHRQD